MSRGLEPIVTEQDQLLVRQVKEWGEILVGFECRNRFELLASDGRRVGFVAEEGQGLGAVLFRNVLGSLRKASLHVADADGCEVGRIEKPFRWFFHRVDVFEDGRKVGAVERRWSWFHRRYVVENASGQEVLEIFSPLFRIWTFQLRADGREIGAIRKKWGGLLREAFSDADTFGVEFPPTGMGSDVRKILLGATFLIDFVHFENNNRSNSMSFVGD